MRVTSLGQKKEKMKYKLVLVGILMGVLSSCTKYRIKGVEHPNGVSYYFPQKKTGLGSWLDLSPTGSYTYLWAVGVIKDDKEINSTKVKYYSYQK